MHFTIVKYKGNERGEPHPGNDSEERNRFKVPNGYCARNVEERNRERCKAKHAMRDIPGILVLNGPRQAKARMPVKRQPGRDYP